MYSFTELRMMNKNHLDEVLNTFQCVRVPITHKQRVFLYFRAYPGDLLDGFVNQKNLFQLKKFKYSSQKRLNFNEPEKRSKTTIKSYANPYEANPKPSKEEEYKQTSRKIIKNFPKQRTLLVVNYDSLYEHSFLKEVFQIHGKVRRIFNETIHMKGEGKPLFMSIVIFKNEIDMVKLFDIQNFQFELLKKFSKRFKYMTSTEQEDTFNQYIKAIRDKIDFKT